MEKRKVEHGNKINWKQTKVDKQSQTYSITTGVNKVTRDRMEHFAPKMVMMGWIKHLNKYAVAKFALEQYFAALADEETKGRI
jgi:hypothetical protein